MIFLSVTVKRMLCILLFSATLACVAQDTTEVAERENVIGDTLGGTATTIRVVPEEVAEKMKKEKEFRYANDASYWKEKPATTPSFFIWLERLLMNRATEVVLYVILGVIVIFALYQIVVVNRFSLFSRSATRKKQSESLEEVPVEDLEQNLSRAIAGGNYRLAVRLSYLLTLNRLNANQEIKLRAMATNYDYLNQMRSSPRYQDFNRLTSMYEYVWYGEFEPDRSQFETMRHYFSKFNQS